MSEVQRDLHSLLNTAVYCLYAGAGHMSHRQTIDVDLSWRKDSPMRQCFADPCNERYDSEWFPIQPPLPHATILSQSILTMDITPTPEDSCIRWSHAAEINEDGSAVRVTIYRWKNTRPEGVVIRVVVDNLHVQVMQYVQHLENENKRLADETKRLQAKADKQTAIIFQRNNLQEHLCDLHGTLICDARRMLDENWEQVNKMVADYKQDRRFKVVYGVGNHNAGPPGNPPMKQVALDWFKAKGPDKRYYFDKASFCHVIHYKPS